MGVNFLKWPILNPKDTFSQVYQSHKTENIIKEDKMHNLENIYIDRIETDIQTDRQTDRQTENMQPEIFRY